MFRDLYRTEIVIQSDSELFRPPKILAKIISELRLMMNYKKQILSLKLHKKNYFDDKNANN